MSAPSVMWFRRDLRLQDNPALREAVAAGPTVPLFVLDPRLWGCSGLVRRAYLSASLRALDASLGGALVIRSGDPVEVVPAVVREASARSVHVAADYAPYGSARDTHVEEALGDTGARLHRTGSPYAVAPGRVRQASGEPYRVYSPFARAWAEHGWREPVPAPVDPRWHRLAREELPPAPLPEGVTLPPVGEAAARENWADFLARRLPDYADGRNLPGADASSRMSTYLRWGEIHPRTMLADLAACSAPATAVQTYRRELAWREFYADVLWHRPDSARADLRPEFMALGYDAPGEHFEAWQQGRTGFPIVDAGMREMLATGRMHNRVRMITASFLVKDLHVWWRHGARWFMERLADGDLAPNQHGWQWVAGSGTDPAPYFRVFNPTLQGRKFDPDGDYVRRWVPELAHLPAAEIHEPRGVAGYPAPIVEHRAERAEALRRYEAMKAQGPAAVAERPSPAAGPRPDGR